MFYDTGPLNLSMLCNYVGCLINSALQFLRLDDLQNPFWVYYSNAIFILHSYGISAEGNLLNNNLLKERNLTYKRLHINKEHSECQFGLFFLSSTYWAGHLKGRYTEDQPTTNALHPLHSFEFRYLCAFQLSQGFTALPFNQILICSGTALWGKNHLCRNDSSFY